MFKYIIHLKSTIISHLLYLPMQFSDLRNLRWMLWILDAILQRIQFSVDLILILYLFAITVCLLRDVRPVSLFVISQFFHQRRLQFLAARRLVVIVGPGVEKHVCLTVQHEAFKDLAASVSVIQDPVWAVEMLIFHKTDVMSQISFPNMSNHSLQSISIFLFVLTKPLSTK